MATTKGKMYLGDILLSGSIEEYSYNQINDVAKGFIENVSYSPSDYSNSSITSYATTTTNYAKSKPKGYTISLPSGELEIIDTSNGGVIKKTISKGDYTFYNITPNSNGYYIVRNNGEIIEVGSLAPNGTLRMIYNEAELFRNCRDLGGWNCDGGKVKYGLLFRGNEPYGKITDNDKSMWVDFLKLKKEINLQTASEIGNRTESGFGSSVDMFCIDITYETLDYWKTSGKTKIVIDELFDYIINGQPTFYHCTAGADRTGYLSLLILAILGVSQSDIDKDYELTCFSTGADTDTNARRRNETDWTSRITYLNTYSGSTFRDKVINYLAQCGISIDKINEFRKAVIDGTPSNVTADIDTFQITKTLNQSTIDNSINSIYENQPFEAEIKANNGHVIEDIVVTMGGVDITKDVVSIPYGSNSSSGETLTKHNVTLTLNEATSNNTQTEVIDGQSYGAVISVSGDVTIASISVTMGGVAIPTDNLIYKEV